jgi:hypothetical protein
MSSVEWVPDVLKNNMQIQNLGDCQVTHAIAPEWDGWSYIALILVGCSSKDPTHSAQQGDGRHSIHTFEFQKSFLHHSLWEGGASKTFLRTRQGVTLQISLQFGLSVRVTTRPNVAI